MASLNIPFLVFSRSNFVFESDESCYTSIITSTTVDEDQQIADGTVDTTLTISDYCGETIFFTLDVDSRTVIKRHPDNESLRKSYKSYFHMLVHPKLLLVPSISMKEKIGILLDATIVKSPTKFILSTSDDLWVTLHSDNVVRIWGMSDGRCLMWSPKELFLTKLKRIISIPTYDGYLLCFGEEGDIYIINLFRMRLLKHSSIDIDGIAHVQIIQIDETHVRFLVTDDKGKITTWRIKANKFDMNIQNLCSDHDLDIAFEMSRLLNLSDRHNSKYLHVFTPSENDEDLLMVTTTEIMVKTFERNIENIVVVDKFNIQGHIIFAATIHKNEGIYVMIMSSCYDLYIDRFDQLLEQTAPLIKINLIESSELNGK